MRTIHLKMPTLMLLLLLVAGYGASAQTQTNLIAAPTGAIWRYNQVDDVTVDPNWTTTNYNDSGWQVGPSGFSYETGGNDVRHSQANPSLTLVRTALNNPANDPPAVTRHARYFRHTFEWTNGSVHSLHLRMRWDDSGVIYLNGQLLYNNTGETMLPISHTDTTVRGAIGSGQEGTVWEEATVNVSSILQPGTNVIAGAVYQSGSGSSDIVFVCGVTALLPYGPFIDDPNEPADRTIVQSRPTTLRVVASGFPPPAYQWYHDSQPIDPAINPSATNAALVIAHMSAADAGEYYCQVSNLSGVTNSRTATVGYIADTTPPTVLGVSSVHPFEIGVLFDEEMDSNTVTSIFGYRINGGPEAGGPAVTNVILRPDANSVRVQLDTAVTSPFTVEITEAHDYAINPIDPTTTVNGTKWADSGDVGLPALPGNAFSAEPGDVEITAGGADIWGTSDQFHFVHNQRSGDFDVKVKVTRLDPSNTWAKGGLLARETLDGPSVTIHAYTTPDRPPGTRTYEAGRRPTAGANTVEWGSRPASGLPNAWVRLRRNGDIFRAYHGTNGADWLPLAGPVTQVMTETLFVGPAATSHNISRTTVATFRDLADVTYPGATVTINPQPTSQTVQTHQSVTFTSGAQVSGAPASELFYQWQRSPDGTTWTNIPGAMSTSVSIQFPAGDDDGDSFRLIASIPGASATSDAATLTLTPDTVRPTVRSVLGVTATRVIVIFSEPMGDSAADNFIYTIDQGIGVIDAQFVPGNRQRIDLTIDPTTPLTAGTTYTLTTVANDDQMGGFIGAVDPTGNPINPNPTTTSFVSQNYPGDPNALRELPTNTKRALGSLPLRGFDGRMVQIAVNIANNNENAERMLAGSYIDPSTGAPYPNLAPMPTFVETSTINYGDNPAGVGTGRLLPDRAFPGYTAAADNMAMEILTYLEVRSGIYRMGVNSDDGFRVSPATSVSDPNNSITLGEFNGGRAPADTIFDFIVTEDGLYPFRLIWEEGQGGATCEWWILNNITGPVAAVNSDLIKAFRGVLPRPRLTITRSGGDVTLSWSDPEGTYRLEQSSSLTTPSWSELSGATGTGGNYSITVTPSPTGERYYRLQQP